MARLITLAICFSLALLGQDFCALKVFAKWPDGRPYEDDFEAVLMGPDQKPLQTAKGKAGAAEFCDFGFGHHSVELRFGSGVECNPVRVGHIRLIYGFTQNVYVTFNSCSPDRGDGVANACRVYVRVQDSHGMPVPGATLIESRREESQIADRYGRAVVWIAFGRTLRITVSHAGFVPKEESLSCAPEGEWGYSKAIVLEAVH